MTNYRDKSYTELLGILRDRGLDIESRVRVVRALAHACRDDDDDEEWDVVVGILREQGLTVRYSLVLAPLLAETDEKGANLAA